MPRLKPILLFLPVAVVLAGCGATGVMQVRQQKGTGLQRTFNASLEKVYKTFLAAFSTYGGYQVTKEPRALFVKMDPGDANYAFYFQPSADDKATTVEGLLAMRYLNKKNRDNMIKTQFNIVESLLKPEDHPVTSIYVDSMEKAVSRAFDKALSKQVPQAARAGAAKPAPGPSDVDRNYPRAQARPHDFAVIVGIEKYRSLPDADYGERDANTMREYFKGLGIPEEHIVMLTGQRATRTDMASYLEEWLPRNVNKSSRVYFYFSGHGAPDPKTGSAYLMPWNGDPAFLKSSAYALDTLYANLGKLKAGEVVVMLDACFSGAGGRSVIAKGTRPLVVSVEPKVPAGSGLYVLTAASGGEITGSLDKHGHGLFTYYLLKGIQGTADLNSDGHVMLGELHEYLLKTVRRAARLQNREQTPQLKMTGSDLRLY